MTWPLAILAIAFIVLGAARWSDRNAGKLLADCRRALDTSRVLSDISAERDRQSAKGYDALGITFPDEVVAPCLAVCIEGGTRETRGSMTLEVAGERVTVSARADQIVGTGIIEYKTRWKPFDYETYADSRQWRLYTQIFGAQWVTYNVFVLSNTERAGLRLVDVATPTFYPYADVVADTDRLLQDFVGYIHERGLERYVADREATP